MDITFRSNKLAKVCTDSKEAVKSLGPVGAKRLRRRLDDLRDSQNLEDLRSLAGRLHELVGDRAGQFSLDLEHPYRLLLVAADNPPPRKPDGGLDWREITAVEIIAIEDTH